MDKRKHIVAVLLLCFAPWAAMAQEATDGAGLTLSGSGIAVANQTAEVSASGMTVGMDIVLDGVKLRSSKRIVLTPAVRGDNVEREMPQIIVNGRRQDIEFKRRDYKKYAPDVTVVRRKNGTSQDIRYTAVLPYEAWMTNSDVVIAEDLCGCGNLIGSDALALWSMRTPAVAYLKPVAKPKTYELKGTAYIDFPVNKTELYPDYRRNPQELQKIISTINKVKEDNNVTINEVDICGYASPESPYAHNDYLASTRAATLKDYVRQLVSLDDNVFTVSSVAENWAGLRECVADGNLKNKDAILALIDDDTLEPDEKEAKIKSSYPEDYAVMLSTYYPGLRRSDYTVTYTIRPFTVDEASAMLKTNPGQLSLEEMFLVAQTLEPGSEEFNEVFATAVRLFPDDPTANLNAACSEIERGDIESAEKHLAKAGDIPETWNAWGVIAAKNGDMTKATELFKKASDAGLEIATENLNNAMRKY